ncbi:SDR family oxidoreductase [Streptomyces sp. Go-475]|uniref:SDR family oxidoreductase n=1 Tax=Streptomyces sp. Go-475 TaxID=2072505 RepID=UPI0022B80823|nr:SDR family oxidoreductase [Streptomyces sp. Go-475]
MPCAWARRRDQRALPVWGRSCPGVDLGYRHDDPGVARDLGPRGITANVVEAGLMEGGMEGPDPETLKVLLSSLSLQRRGHPAEIAAAIAFLASPTASYVTGAMLDAHGGYNA